jgi:hypothetical protein
MQERGVPELDRRKDARGGGLELEGQLIFHWRRVAAPATGF